MKRLFTIAIIALMSASANAQNKGGIATDTIPVVNGVYQYQEEVKVDSNLKKSQLYRNAKAYVMNVFMGAKDACQYDDKDQGRIIVKGAITVDDIKRFFPSVAVLRWEVNYNVEIICKDGKYEYRLYDMVITKEAHVSESNSRNVHMTMKDAYAAMPKQRGPYKALYGKVMNKLIAEFESNIGTLKENMVKRQPSYSAAF